MSGGSTKAKNRNRTRCHVTGKTERSRYCSELRKWLGYESCPKVCDRLPYGLNRYFQNRVGEPGHALSRRLGDDYIEERAY